MRRIVLRTGFAVFVIFFGIAVVDAFRGGNWIDCIFWMVMGGIFIYADNMPVRDSKADQR